MDMEAVSGSCSHCDAPVPAGGATRYRGRSYHPHCRKCFVCSEIDLLNAETFEGVIFCSACAERIFTKCARRRELETPTVLYANTIPASVDVLSLDKITAQDAVDTNTQPADNKTSSPAPQHLVQAPERCGQLETGDVPAPPSAPRLPTGTCPPHPLHQVYDRDVPAPPSAPGLPTNKSAYTEHKSTAADVGLAELGASVELAQVALRRPSSVRLFIKAGSAFNLELNKSLPQDFKPDTSVSQAISYSSADCERPLGDGIGSSWRRKRFSSVLKIPFKLFKKNILDRSSFITVYTRAEHPGSPPSGLRDLFHDEISKHHSRGAQVLYSTINRQSAPYKLGWVHAATCQTKRKRCRHYRASHDYRCLRAHVMKRAGPTCSELEQLRGKIKRFITGAFVCRMLEEANLTDARAG